MGKELEELLEHERKLFYQPESPGKRQPAEQAVAEGQAIIDSGLQTWDPWDLQIREEELGR